MTEKRSNIRIFQWPFAVIILSCICFCLFYGPYILNPTYTDWILTGDDAVQNFVGVNAFAQSKWFFPIGYLNTLQYPNLTSVIFTDSIPLLAVVFKTISSVLPYGCYQYIGIWALLCCILQGYLSGKLISKYTNSNICITVGSAFFIISPIVIYRFFEHSALMGHWTVLLALQYLVFYKEKYNKTKPAVAMAVALGLIAPSVHMYFLPQCGLVIFFYFIYDLLCTKRPYKGLLTIAAYICSALASIYVLGGFGNSDTFSASGFGYFSFNLNGFFNSYGLSSFFPKLESGPGQYEGFSYLGAGIFALLIIVFIGLFIRKAFISADWKKPVAALIFALACVMMAVSTEVKMGSNTLFNFPFPQVIKKYWAIFRSTGRLIWPLYYCIVLYAVTRLFRVMKRPRLAAGILCLCLVIQVVDLFPLYSIRQVRGNIEYVSGLDEEKWEELIESTGTEHLVLIGLDDNWGMMLSSEYEIGVFAFNHHLTMNRFRMSHKQIPYREEAEEAILSGESGYLFLFKEQEECKKYPQLKYYTLDSYYVGISGDREIDFLQSMEMD